MPALPLQHASRASLCNTSVNNLALNHIAIILVGTTLPANIGAAARAMHTMGLTKLVLVNPKRAIDDTSTAMAAGGARILHTAKPQATLEEALAGTQLSFAMSARKRSMPIPHLDVRHAAHVALQSALNYTQSGMEDGNSPRIAFVFGREDRGLTNEELHLCTFHTSIPANPDYAVLNLAAAVQVAAYELRQAAVLLANRHTNPQDTTQLSTTQDTTLESTQNTPAAAKPTAAHMLTHIRSDWDTPLASHQDTKALEQKMLNLAHMLGIFDPSAPRKTPERIARLLARMQLDQMEYNFLRALVEKAQTRLSDAKK